MEHSCANTILTQADQAWIAAVRKSQATIANFIIARIQDTPDIHQVASSVLCFVDGEFISIQDIVDKCSNHGWNSMVYEAWAWERQNAIHRFAQRLHQPERDSLLLYAHYLDPLDATHADAQEALAEARRKLYGESDDDFDDDYDDDAFDEIESFDPDACSTADVC